MKPLKFLLLLTAGLFILTSCKDKNDISNLPPATQVGANTFGCLINGELYKCSGYLMRNDPFNFQIEGCRFSKVQDEVIIITKSKTSSGNKIFKFKNPEFITGTFTEGIEYSIGTIVPDSDSKFTITRIDNNILSGTFQFTIKRSDGSIMKFTHGRFDIKNENE